MPSLALYLSEILLSFIHSRLVMLKIDRKIFACVTEFAYVVIFKCMVKIRMCVYFGCMQCAL